MIKVVIFDLDGLLIDSQPLQYKAYNRVFSEYGFPISKEEWIDEWINNSISCREWIHKMNLPLDFAKVRAEKQKVYEEFIPTDLELKPGAMNAINLLFVEYKLCIASASMKPSIEVISKKFGFEAFFDQIISDQESHVVRQKPFPDVFQCVAKEMEVAPEECLVIEDSVAGLEAAKSANMKCIICPDSFCEFESSEFEDADKIIKSLNEIDLDMIHELDKD
ncbi:HAD family phosphatase [Patescibacteria group bacterium]|nr:HAD family phosphatase [Patescibacteria group bacterium]